MIWITTSPVGWGTWHVYLYPNSNFTLCNSLFVWFCCLIIYWVFSFFSASHFLKKRYMFEKVRVVLLDQLFLGSLHSQSKRYSWKWVLVCCFSFFSASYFLKKGICSKKSGLFCWISFFWAPSSIRAKDIRENECWFVVSVFFQPAIFSKKGICSKKSGLFCWISFFLGPSTLRAKDIRENECWFVVSAFFQPAIFSKKIYVRKSQGCFVGSAFFGSLHSQSKRYPWKWVLVCCFSFFSASYFLKKRYMFEKIRVVSLDQLLLGPSTLRAKDICENQCWFVVSAFFQPAFFEPAFLSQLFSQIKVILKVVLHQRSSCIKGSFPEKVVFFKGVLWSKFLFHPRSSSFVFHQRLSSIIGCLSSKFIFHQKVYLDKDCFRSKVVFCQRLSSPKLSSIKGCPQSKVIFHQRLSFIKGQIQS